jgi:hypothetical protein
MSTIFKAFPGQEEWEAKQRKLQAENEAEAVRYPNYTFYFVGKIMHTGWRHKIFNLRNIEYPWKAYLTGASPRTKHAIAPGLHYGGPFTVGCDHGCYHGPNTHGTGVNRDTCEGGMWDDWEGNTLPLNQNSFAARIVCNCLLSIRSVDIVFAWIDDLTAYGSLAELGYARAFGKQTWLAWPREFPDLWFIKELASEVVIAQSAEVAFRQLVFEKLGRSVF